MKAELGVILAGLTLSGCSMSTVYRIDDGFEDFFARVEGLPAYARSLEKVPLEDLPKAERGWREYEIGRRFEHGLGLPQDVACATYWYSQAAHSRYEIYDDNPAWRINPPLVTRYGLPWARVALHRLSADVDGDADGPRLAARCRIDTAQRG